MVQEVKTLEEFKEIVSDRPRDSYAMRNAD